MLQDLKNDQNTPKPKKFSKCLQNFKITKTLSKSRIAEIAPKSKNYQNTPKT